jgi:hypothetical protein
MTLVRCIALVIAFPAFTAATGPISSDPLIGSWRADLASSRFAPSSPRPRALTIICVSSVQRRIACAATRTALNGDRSTARFSARYDGRAYPISGMREANVVRLRRDGADVIAAFGRGPQPIVAYRMTRSADGRHLTVRSIHPRTGRMLFTTVRYDLVPSRDSAS